MAINGRYYNRTNTCSRCGKNFDNMGYYPLRECDDKGDWTGRWDCNSCWSRYDPNSRTNIRRRLASCRTGNFNPNSTLVKGKIFEELTCRWRGVKNLNVENDNYKSPIDHSRDSKLGIIQTKGRLYDDINRLWNFARLEIDHNKNFDNIICYCASKNGKRIERIYIFPKSEIIKRMCIAIMKNPIKSIISWNEKYRVKDEDTLKIVNDIFENIISGI